MKTIEPISIWDNGAIKQAVILDSYASLVSLGISATFYYAMYSENEEGYLAYQLATGNLTMSGEAYQQWAQDSYAWDWIAEQLNLTITGDYVPPVPPEPIVEEIIAIEEPIV